MEIRCLTIRYGLTFPLNFSVLLSSRISELPYRTYRLAAPEGCPHQPAPNTGCRWAVAGGRGALQGWRSEAPKAGANKPSTRTPYQILCASLVDIGWTGMMHASECWAVQPKSQPS